MAINRYINMHDAPETGPSRRQMVHNSEIEREGGGGDFVRKREAAATSCARGRATGQRRQCPPFSILFPLIPPPADPFPFSILLPLIRRRAGSWLSCSCTSSSQSRARSSRLSPRFFRLSRPVSSPYLHSQELRC
uniref:Uncharacterized protein n=1 Tax=Oryza barthii TaxID=65489 RepID=A0A0D3FG06_9ORYZ